MRLDFLPRLQMMPTVYFPAACEGEEAPVDHECRPCDEGGEGGQVRDVSFVVDGFAINTPSVATEWLAGMGNRNVIVIPDIIGSFNGGEPIPGPGYGHRTSSNLGYNFELVFRDRVYAANADFYIHLAKRQNLRVAFSTETQTHLSDKTVSITAKQAVTDNKDDGVVWEVTVRWRQSTLLKPFNTPPGVFRCYTLEEEAPAT